MKEFSVCYDRFCLGNYTLVCDVSDTVQATADLGAFEMYVLGMWNDGLVVTMKAYDEVCDENQFVLLVPDGSEQLMSFPRVEVLWSGHTGRHVKAVLPICLISYAV